MRRVHKKWMPWIIIIICIGIVMFVRPLRRLYAFQNYKAPIVDVSIKDPIISEEIMKNYKKNCGILFNRIKEIQKVKLDLDNIKHEINSGAVNVQKALLKLQTSSEILNCNSSSPSQFCPALGKAFANFKEQMDPKKDLVTNLPNTTQTTVAGLNALINNEYENILAYSKLINTMQASLRCYML